MSNTENLTYGTIMLNDMMHRLLLVEHRRLSVPPPPATTDPDYQDKLVVWQQEVVDLGNWIVEQCEAIEQLRSQFHGIGQAVIGPVEHGILEELSDLDDPDMPQSIIDEEELMQEKLNVPLALSAQLCRIITDWANHHMTSDEWASAMLRAARFQEEHPAKLASNRASKARKAANKGE